MERKIHKAGCAANISCAVYHLDGICPGPYGKCTCHDIEEKPTNVSDIDITKIGITTLNQKETSLCNQ